MLADRAMKLRARADALKTAPILSRMSGAQELADDLAGLVCEMASRLDALTPFADECPPCRDQHQGGGDNPLISGDDNRGDMPKGEA
ncbi:hypothetical protein [Thioclava dalianensis]|uniref:hypothetical protein n=1 Tax=Thioclava dalianensis TaxID=1185766 RepID=UPI0011604EA7|nr:hypothetical protein [Thioclava dalianensis]